MTRCRLFILGAGASYAAGLPDGDRLLSHLFGYIGGTPRGFVDNSLPYEYWGPLYDTLFQILRELATGGRQSTWPLDDVFDLFYKRLRADPEIYGPQLGLLQEATAELIYSRSGIGGTSEVYLKFARALQPGDIVLTFNWDSCVEIALNTIDKLFSRSLDTNPPKDQPWLLKLHGSIDYLVVTSAIYEVEIKSSPYGYRQNLGKLKKSFSMLPFLELLKAQPPGVNRDYQYYQFELARLKTYDLEGYSIEVSSNMTEEEELELEESAGKISGGWDVGAFRLMHVLSEYPTIFYLTPGISPLLYDWYYGIIRDALLTAVSEIEHIYVTGYSFPQYDERVFAVLETITNNAGHPPTDIIDPGANKLSPEILQRIFGEYQLHACGFQEFDWDA